MVCDSVKMMIFPYRRKTKYVGGIGRHPYSRIPCRLPTRPKDGNVAHMALIRASAHDWWTCSVQSGRGVSSRLGSHPNAFYEQVTCPILCERLFSGRNTTKMKLYCSTGKSPSRFQYPVILRRNVEKSSLLFRTFLQLFSGFRFNCWFCMPLADFYFLSAFHRISIPHDSQLIRSSWGRPHILCCIGQKACPVL